MYGVFKRPLAVSVIVISSRLIRQDTAACVSLSKSTMSKNRNRSAIPPFSARLGGGGYLATPDFRVNRKVSENFPVPTPPKPRKPSAPAKAAFLPDHRQPVNPVFRKTVSTENKIPNSSETSSKHPDQQTQTP
jgi:hypothetical protein